MADDADRWASEFFDAMLARRLTCADFEAAVAAHWASGDFVQRAPRTAERLLALATKPQALDAGYAGEAAELGFRSQWLVGVPGNPGAIHIQAPAETTPGAHLWDLNRRPHRHDSGRIALVTHGTAIFHVVRELSDVGPVILDCPVQAGDLVFWPAETPHTFDALEGFWLVSAMADYVSPAEDGFVLPAGEPDVEAGALPRKAYRVFRQEMENSGG